MQLASLLPLLIAALLAFYKDVLGAIRRLFTSVNRRTPEAGEASVSPTLAGVQHRHLPSPLAARSPRLAKMSPSCNAASIGVCSCAVFPLGDFGRALRPWCSSPSGVKRAHVAIVLVHRRSSAGPSAAACGGLCHRVSAAARRAAVAAGDSPRCSSWMPGRRFRPMSAVRSAVRDSLRHGGYKAHRSRQTGVGISAARGGRGHPVEHQPRRRCLQRGLAARRAAD